MTVLVRDFTIVRAMAGETLVAVHPVGKRFGNRLSMPTGLSQVQLSSDAKSAISR